VQGVWETLERMPIKSIRSPKEARFVIRLELSFRKNSRAAFIRKGENRRARCKRGREKWEKSRTDMLASTHDDTHEVFLGQRHRQKKDQKERVLEEN